MRAKKAKGALIARSDIVGLTLGLVALTACGAKPDITTSAAALSAPSDTVVASDTTAPAVESTEATATTVPPTLPPPPPGFDPAGVGANELGDIPVLMYHELQAAPENMYDCTPDDFRAEMQRLAAEGYIPITAAEFARRDFSAVPAGSHPVVLTFDDSTTTQFALGADNQPVAGTAVAILLEVAAQNPAFRPVATMYVNKDPFADSGGVRTLPWLAEHGFEIGNHTLEHENLKKIDTAAARAAIAADAAAIAAAIPGIVVTTFALPYGVMPDDPGVAVAGEANGTAYSHEAVFLVGSEPSPSPYRANYDAAKVPRVRSQGLDGDEPEYGSTAWLDKLAADPARRFTSDGDPARVSFPSARADDLAPAHSAAANPY